MFEELENLLESGQEKTINRRQVMKLGVAGFLATTIPFLTRPALASAPDNAWRVAFRSSHTGESFNGVYRVGNRYLPDAFERLNYVLRDFRTGDVFPMDPRVLDILAMVQRRTRSSKPFEVLSGYRSPRTNSYLRHNSGGVARNSFHMYGQALDIRAPGVSTGTLRKTAINLQAGGVGYYPRSGFVHIDTGEVRSW